ncbi:MAG: hypothetical protein ABIH46_11305 [Chloroflexota bacterium]
MRIITTLILVFLGGLFLGASLSMLVFGAMDAARHDDEAREVQE